MCTSEQGPHPLWPRFGASRRRAMACIIALPRREEQPYDLAASMRAQLLQWQRLRQPLQALQSPEHGCVGITPCKRTLPCSAPLPAKRRKRAPLAAPAWGSVQPSAAVGRLKARVEQIVALPGRTLGSLGSDAAGAPLRSRVLNPESPGVGPSALAAAVLARVLPGRALATSGAAPAQRGPHSAAAAGRRVQGRVAEGKPAGLRLKVSPGRCAAAAAKARAAKEARRPSPRWACMFMD